MTSNDERILKQMSQLGYTKTDDGKWVRNVKTSVPACCCCHSKIAQRNGRCEDCVKLSD